MKSLIYSALRLNRGYFIGAALTFLISTAVGAPLLYSAWYNGSDFYRLGNLCVYILPVLPIVIISEFYARDLERNIKSGFLNYTLSAMTRRKFVLSQLVTNLCCTGLGLLLGLELLLIFRAVNPEYVPPEMFGGLSLMALAGSVAEWIIIPVTIRLKSAEKAGLIVGLLIGFGIVLPMILVYKVNGYSLGFNLVSLLNIQYVLIFLATALLIYAGVFASCISLLKRGAC